ncbi:hypothetical protein ABE473_02730 [Stenotrophomonas sp. TWI700]
MTALCVIWRAVAWRGVNRAVVVESSPIEKAGDPKAAGEGEASLSRF